MNKEELQKKVSELESINDQLQAELRYLDTLFKELGFAQGLTTLKHTAEEMIEIDRQIG
jgi:hypothetical protein